MAMLAARTYACRAGVSLSHPPKVRSRVKTTTVRDTSADERLGPMERSEGVRQD